jgi:hypothetical protein
VAYFGWLIFHPNDELINSTWPWQIFLVYLPCALLLAFPHLTRAAKSLSASVKSTPHTPDPE